MMGNYLHGLGDQLGVGGYMGLLAWLEKKLAENDGMGAKSKPRASMSLRVYRAATDTWEDGPEVNTTLTERDKRDGDSSN